MIQALGEAFDQGWQLRAHCDRRRDGLKSARACIGTMVLDLESLLWTHGWAYPAAQLPSRLKCPRCGSRQVLGFWVAPGSVLRMG